jgi:predicted transcriptional regulator
MPDDSQEIEVPREYCETIGTLLVLKLKSAGYSRGVIVSVGKAQPKVRVALKKVRERGYYVQMTDLRPAYADGIDPVDVVKDIIRTFTENVTHAEQRN